MERPQEGKKFSIFRSAANAAINASRHVSSSIVQGLQSFDSLLGYEILQQNGVQICAWSVYPAKRTILGTNSSKSEEASVWVLDVNQLGQRWGCTQKECDRIMQLCAKDAKQLVKLRHPCILKVLTPVQEIGRRKIAFASEAVLSGLDSAIFTQNQLEIINGAQKIALSSLEIKYGLVCVGEALDFLHHKARIVHRGVSPSACVITSQGRWKLASFQYSLSLEDSSIKYQLFSFEEGISQKYGYGRCPNLEYTAPEAVDSPWTTPIPSKCSADVFSFALLAAYLLFGVHVIPKSCSLSSYRRIMMSWNPQNFTENHQINSCLMQMLSLGEGTRPEVAVLGRILCQEKSVQALHFLDKSINKSEEQKISFLKELPNICSLFSSNIVTHYLLDFLLDQVKADGHSMPSLKLLLELAPKIEQSIFETKALPVILSLVSTCNKSLHLKEILAHANSLLSRVPGTRAQELIILVLKRSIGDNIDPELQSCGLQTLRNVFGLLPTHEVRNDMLQMVIECFLKTTSAAVRVKALNTLEDMLEVLKDNDLDNIMKNVELCSSADQSATTSMAVVSLTFKMCRILGSKFAATRVLPLIGPMLAFGSLSDAQFQKVSQTIKAILQLVEESRQIPKRTPVKWNEEKSNKGNKNSALVQMRRGPVLQMGKSTASKESEPFKDLLL